MLLCLAATCVLPVGVGGVFAARNLASRYPAALGEAGCALPVLQTYYSPGYFEVRVITFSCAVTADDVEDVIAWYEAGRWRRQFGALRVAKFSGWQWGPLKLDVRRSARVYSGGMSATHINAETRLTFIAKKP